MINKILKTGSILSMDTSHSIDVNIILLLCTGYRNPFILLFKIHTLEGDLLDCTLRFYFPEPAEGLKIWRSIFLEIILVVQLIQKNKEKISQASVPASNRE